jgi:hypothetical protein
VHGPLQKWHMKPGGDSVVAASIARLTQLHEVEDTHFMCKSSLISWNAPGHSLTLLFSNCLIVDAVGGFSNSVIWCSAEPSVAVISACLPTMQPLAEFILPKYFRARAYRQSSGSKSRTQPPCTEMLSFSAKNPRGDQDPKIDYLANMHPYGSHMRSNSEEIAVGGRSYQKFDNKSSESHEIRIETNIEVSESARSIV